MVACAKGIERGTHKFMTEVIAEAAPQASRRSFPAELRRRRRARAADRGDVAATDEGRRARWCRHWARATFRPYHTTDVRGVEIGGAAKNVLAIAAGIVVGRELGAGAAALTTRGFAEWCGFGRACGARPETLTAFRASAIWS